MFLLVFVAMIVISMMLMAGAISMRKLGFFFIWMIPMVLLEFGSPLV